MKITISGFPGAGKGTLIKRLEEEYKIPSFSVGQLRREYALSHGMNINELNHLGEQNSLTDTTADAYQKQWAKENSNFILDGRLSYFFTPESIKIFLTVDSLEGARRIQEAARESEKAQISLEERIKTNQLRCESDIRRYNSIYGIENCYDEDNFDIILDTTHRNPDEVFKLVKKKIIDYNQKMNPPKFYLAHPTESRQEIREWEAGFEERTGIQLVNPFHECTTLETELGNIGKEKYSKLKEQVTKLYAGDLEQISRKDILGGIVILDDNWTWGTPAEQATMWMMSKLIYTITLNKEKDYFNHPVVRFYSGNNVFSSKEDLEKHMIENKNYFFRDLERLRRDTAENPIYQTIMKEIKKNQELGFKKH